VINGDDQTTFTAEHVNTGSADAAASGASIRSLMDQSHEGQKASAGPA
jgi:hypothetical protein